MKKKCELCESVAKMYCESDQASLCWDCDIKVHGANFIVAKHSRTLLCHVCQSLTPWNGSGLKLGPTVSVCDACVNSSTSNKESTSNEGNDEEQEDDDRDENDGDGDGDGDDGDDGDGDGDGDGGDDDDEENQVVPWSPPTPPVSSSCLSSGGLVAAKKKNASVKASPNQEQHFHGNACAPAIHHTRIFKATFQKHTGEGLCFSISTKRTQMTRLSNAAAESISRRN